MLNGGESDMLDARSQPSPSPRSGGDAVSFASSQAARTLPASPSALAGHRSDLTPVLNTGPIELPVDSGAPAHRWLPRYVAVLVALDALALMMGGTFGRLVRFDTLGGNIHGVAYFDVLVAAIPAWIVAMATARSYEGRFLGVGSEEYRRVGNAAARFTALLAVIIFLFNWNVARGLVVLALPASMAFALYFRYLARQVLHRIRETGIASHRVLVIGDGTSRDALVNRLRATPYSGLRVVGVCQPVTRGADGVASVAHIRRMVRSLRVDTLAVAHSPSVDPGLLRQIAWSLEGIGVDLLVAPALTDVAGPRVNIRPISGVPLLQVTEPEFTGVRRFAKTAFDVVVAGLGLIVISPLMLSIAAAIRIGSKGPALFRQVRIGQDGKEFVMYKFRSMHTDAEARLEELRTLNDHADGVMFKMRDDPRITSVGKYLRRFSLDELPQLFNVVLGHMSLVGPRPPLPSEVAQYSRHVHRRLLVKPGLTGLWQVSGRADLDWDETVRLDLYYVENWSVALDAEIIWKTIWAVLRGSGAR